MNLKRVHLLFLITFVFGLNAMAQKLSFIENKGQWEENFQYKLDLGDGAVFLSSDELVFKFTKITPNHSKESEDPLHPNQIYRGDIIKGHSYKVSFLGANQTASSVDRVKKEGYLNYLLGKDRAKWKSKVGRYESFTFQNVYDGIDAKYYFTGDGNLKYDLVLHPDADPNSIVLQYQGVDDLSLVYGNLMVHNSIEDVLESAPYAYQEIDGERKEVKCKYHLEGNQLSFDVGRYDSKYPLIIDPTLIFSTFSGSTADNFGFTATYGEDGVAYGGGVVYNNPSTTSYPVSLGAFQDTFQGGDVDVSITKFLADGTNFIYSTYLGGSRNEVPHSMVEGPNKELIIIGSTGSSNFPTSIDAYDTVFDPGRAATISIGASLNYPQGADIFISKLDSTGGVLEGSTFFGGDEWDGVNGAFENRNYGDVNRGEVIVDSLGIIYGVASTNSSTLPSFNGGSSIASSTNQDGIAFSFSSNLKNLRWNTYFASHKDEALYSLKKFGNHIFVAGVSDSSALSFTAGGSPTPLGRGKLDGFVAKLNATNGSVSNYTYNGTPEHDVNFLIDLDLEGNVYVLGQTDGNYAVSSPTFFRQSNGSIFINMFSNDLSASLKSTTLGDNNLSTRDISPTAFMVDNCKNIYLSGWGSNLMGTGGGVQTLPTTNNVSSVHGARRSTDGYDFYLMVLDESWEKVNFGAYFGINSSGGGDHVDGGTSRYSKDGVFYQAVCAGCSNTSGFPTSPGAYARNTESNGPFGCNMALVKLSLESDVSIDFIPDKDSLCVPFQVSLINQSYNADIYRYELPDGSLIPAEPSGFLIDKVGDQSYKIWAEDTTCGSVDSLILSFHGITDSLLADFDTDNDSCDSEFEVNFSNNSIDAQSYFWNFGDGSFSVDKNPVHKYTQAGDYVVSLVGNNTNCNITDTLQKIVYIRNKAAGAQFETEYQPCVDGTIARFEIEGDGMQHYIWSIDGVVQADTNIFVHDFLEDGTYSISLEAIDSNCNFFFSEDQIITISNRAYSVEMPNVFSPNGDDSNMLFGPIGSFGENFFEHFSMKIYNRWGIELFATDNPSIKWDGTFEGNLLDEGVYYYLTSYSTSCGEAEETNGFVHLMH